ncbi:MAG: TonB-dependent receptor, partial [Gammaproteobacteria bacterium]
PKLQLEAVGFGMQKQDYILRDSNGFNVSDGKSDHYGVEAQLKWRPWDPVYFGAVGSYARHTYEFDRDAALRETIISGNDVDTAPQILASARVGYEQRFVLAELEWVHMDPYFLDAANTVKYQGHDLWNLRVIFTPTPSWWLGVRVNNLTDELYADRADFAFGNHRYFPGREREVYVQLGYRTH